jgi:hypothetical protein
MDDNVERIFGPTPPTHSGGIIYSVTLGNGYPVTNPGGFPEQDEQRGNQAEQTPMPLPVRRTA